MVVVKGGNVHWWYQELIHENGKGSTNENEIGGVVWCSVKWRVAGDSGFQTTKACCCKRTSEGVTFISLFSYLAFPSYSSHNTLILVDIVQHCLSFKLLLFLFATLHINTSRPRPSYFCNWYNLFIQATTSVSLAFIALEPTFYYSLSLSNWTYATQSTMKGWKGVVSFLLLLTQWWACLIANLISIYYSIFPWPFPKAF